MVPKLSKTVHFLKFCADLRKSIKAIYIYASESSRYALSKHGNVYYGITYCFGGINVSAESVSFLISYLLISHKRW